MKILIISPSLKMGGIERALSTLANFFAEKGYQIFFISCQENESFYRLKNEVHLQKFNYPRTSGSINKFFFYYNLVWYLRKKASEINPDYVLSFGDVFNPLVLLALIKLNYPVFISDRTCPYFSYNSLVRFGQKMLYPLSTGYIAQTESAARYKRIQFKNKLNIKVIPNAIKPVELFPDLNREQQITYIGRLSKEKGVERLIIAFNKIKNKNWKCVLAGDGPEKKKLEKLVKILGLHEKVLFLGPIKDIDRLLARSSIFVLPSFREGFPNALVEAMAAGLPSICFDSIPYQDLIIDGYNGFVVNNNNIEDLTQIIDRLAENDGLRLEIGENAMEIGKRLNVDVIGREYIDFFHNSK